MLQWKKAQTHIHQIRQKASTFFFYLRTYLHLFAEFLLWPKKFRGQQNTTNDLSQFIRIQTNPHWIFAYIQKKNGRYQKPWQYAGQYSTIRKKCTPIYFWAQLKHKFGLSFFFWLLLYLLSLVCANRAAILIKCLCENDRFEQTRNSSKLISFTSNSSKMCVDFRQHEDTPKSQNLPLWLNPAYIGTSETIGSASWLSWCNCWPFFRCQRHRCRRCRCRMHSSIMCQFRAVSLCL